MMQETKHLMLRISDVRVRRFKQNVLIHNLMLDAVHAAGGHVVNVVKHEFHPEGLTSIIVLSESHASIHTWPENDIGLVDFFSCAEDPRFDDFVSVWEGKGFKIDDRQEITR